MDVQLRVTHARGQTHGRTLRAHARRYLDALGLTEVELSLSVVTDRQIRALNRIWRDKDQVTDVLSFPAAPLPPGTPGLRPLGDVVISLDTARRQAREYERRLGEELSRYLAHGILHLLGHDHHTPAEARKMAREENRLLGVPGMVSTSARPRRAKRVGVRG